MHVETSFEMAIDAPRDRVFATLTDPARLPAWQPEVVEVEVVGGGALRPGAMVREVRRVAGRRAEQVVEVATFDPPHRLGLRVREGGVPFHGDWTLEACDGDRTRLRLRAFGEVPAPVGLAAPLLRPVVRWQLRRHHRRLAALVEGA